MESLWVIWPSLVYLEHTHAHKNLGLYQNQIVSRTVPQLKIRRSKENWTNLRKSLLHENCLTTSKMKEMKQQKEELWPFLI